MVLHSNIFDDSSLIFRHDHSWLAAESLNQTIRTVEPVVVDVDDSYDLVTHDRGWVDCSAPGGKTRAVLYPDGKRRTFEYASSGALIRFSTKDGGSWRKLDEVWNFYDKAGAANGQCLPAGSSCDVDRNGRFIFVDVNGQQTIEGPDGSLLVRAADGKVIKVMQPDGNTRQFEYGPSNELIKFTTMNGSYWKKDGSCWGHFDVNNYSTGKSFAEGTICRVDDDGNFIFTEKNGTKTTEAPDGSVVIKNDMDKIVWVTQPDGAFKGFEYDQDGGLIRFSTTDDACCKKEASFWCHYDKSGKLTHTEPDGTRIHVDSAGDFVITYINGRKEITHVDGSLTVCPQGTAMTDLLA